MAPIDKLLDLEIPDAIKLSPNSRQVVYSTSTPRNGDQDLSSIWIADTGYAGSSRRLTPGSFNDHAPSWCPDGKSIAFVSDRAKQGEQWAIYSLQLESDAEPKPLTSVDNASKVESIKFSPDGRSIAYLSADEKTPEQKTKEKEKDDARVWDQDWPFNRLRVVDVENQAIKTIARRDAHITAFAWNDDGSKIAFFETRTPDIESGYRHGTKACTLDMSTLEINELCVFPTKFSSLQFAGDSIYAHGPSDPSTMISDNAVYSLDTTQLPSAWKKSAYGENESPRDVGKAEKDITVKIENGHCDEIHMLNGPVIFSREKKISTWDAAFTTDSDEMIVAVAQGDVNNAPEVFTITASGGRMVQLSNHGQPLQGKHFGRSQFLQCKSSDGQVDLDGVWFTPTAHILDNVDKPPHPLPTIVFIHGGPYHRVTDEFDPSYFFWLHTLLDTGYAVFFPNYRGSSGRGQSFAAYARGGVGDLDYGDVITLTQHAIELEYADKDRLIVGGWSQGGFMSYLSAVRNGQHGLGWKFKGAIPGAGVCDWDTLMLTSDVGGTMEAELSGKAPWYSEKSDITNRRGSALWEFKAAVDQGDVIPPVLILHGEKDERCPLTQAIGFRRALESASLPFEMVVYPREPHLFRERTHIKDTAERVVKFVEKYIGGG